MHTRGCAPFPCDPRILRERRGVATAEATRTLANFSALLADLADPLFPVARRTEARAIGVESRSVRGSIRASRRGEVGSEGVARALASSHAHSAASGSRWEKARGGRGAHGGETGLIRARWPSGFPLMFDSCVWADSGRRSVREECEDA